MGVYSQADKGYQDVKLERVFVGGTGNHWKGKIVFTLLIIVQNCSRRENPEERQRGLIF